MISFKNKGISTTLGVLIILLVTVIIGGGVYLWQQINSISDLASNQPNGETAGWQTYTNLQYGFEFKYPETFGTNVWRAFFWPPTTTAVSINDDPVAKGCPNFPVAYLDYQNSNAATKKEVTINNIDYFLYWATDGAAGSSYKSYCYVTKKGQKYYVIDFFIRTTNGCGQNCGPYCGTQYEQECLNFNLVKDVEKPIKQIMSTFKFLEKNSTGTIEGSLSYPSDFIPTNMKVCAENIGTKEQYCTDDHIKNSKYRYGEGYRINLPFGDYYVFAILPNWVGYRAYYSEFVTCGIKAGCPSHDPIKVTVTAEETTGNIDPWDWYKTN